MSDRGTARGSPLLTPRFPRPPLKLLSITCGNVAGYGPYRLRPAKSNWNKKKEIYAKWIYIYMVSLKPRVKGENAGIMVCGVTNMHTRYSGTNSQSKLIKSAFGVSAQALTTGSNLGGDLLQLCHTAEQSCREKLQREATDMAQKQSCCCCFHKSSFIFFTCKKKMYSSLTFVWGKKRSLILRILST